MFVKILFYRVINLFNKNKLKLKNIGCKSYLFHPDGVYQFNLEKNKLYKLTVVPEIKIEEIS